MTTPYFTGPFAPMCELFVTQKRAAGLVYEQQAMILRMFDNFCKVYDVEDYVITEEIALAWGKLRPNEKENFRYSRVSEMQRFSVFLSKQGYSSYLLAGMPKKGELHTPYIFKKEEIKRLFERLDVLEPVNTSPYKHMSFPVLFRMLYGCGLRISDALAFQKCDIDVDAGILLVRKGKNNIERMVPMSDSLTKVCRGYMESAHANTQISTPLFYKRDFAPYTISAIEKAFRGFLWDIGIPYRGKDFGPRVHDLRHTFICHNIHQWTEQGISIENMLPVLSKYVGHSSISGTQWYLRLTSEVYPHLREICERELGGMYANIPNLGMRGDYDA